jgi:hypothetical protein
MKALIPLAAALLLSACSDAPVATKTPEKPPEALTGREAFYKTYPAARAWASDAEPVRVRSMEINEMKAIGGQAAAWEVMYVSASKARSRTYTWSAVEASGNLHKGVFGGHDEAWQPGAGDKPFVIQALKIDTPDALQTAIEHSDIFFKSKGIKPHAKFELTLTARFPDPAWRIYWGDSVSTAEWNVFVDATTGEYQGR